MSASASQPIHLAGAILGGQRHVCGFFDGPEDEHRVTLSFVQEGLERKELAFHIVDPAERDNYARRLEQDGIRVAELERSGGFELRTWPDTYLRGGKFDPAAMLALLEEVVQRRAPRFPLVRFVAHMNFPNADQKTWNDWVEYEARLNQVLAKYPDPLLCAYETRQYNGAVLLDVQRAHPAVIIGGSLQSNPFFKASDRSPGGSEGAAARADTAARTTKRREAIAARKEKQSLEQRERALAIVSHDLRNPLSAILVGAFALQQEARLPVGCGSAGEGGVEPRRQCAPVRPRRHPGHDREPGRRGAVDAFGAQPGRANPVRRAATPVRAIQTRPACQAFSFWPLPSRDRAVHRARGGAGAWRQHRGDLDPRGGHPLRRAASKEVTRAGGVVSGSEKVRCSRAATWRLDAHDQGARRRFLAARRFPRLRALDRRRVVLGVGHRRELLHPRLADCGRREPLGRRRARRLFGR